MPRLTKNSSTPSSPKLPSDDCLSGEGKKIFQLLSEKLDSILNSLKERDDKLQQLELENKDLKSELQKVNNRLDDIESHSRCNNIVLSGSEVSSLTADIPVHGVIELLKRKLQYNLSSESILTAYRLGSKSSNQSRDSRRLMVKFRDQGVKEDVMAACRRVKPANLYANDDLTPVRANILYILRQAKRKSHNKIVACGSMKGRIYVFIKPTNPSARNQKVYLNDMQKLEEFCIRELGVTLAELSNVDSGQ